MKTPQISNPHMFGPLALSPFRMHAFRNLHKTKRHSTLCTNFAESVGGWHFGCTFHVLHTRCIQDICIAFLGTHCTFDLEHCRAPHCACIVRRGSWVHSVCSMFHTSRLLAGHCTARHVLGHFSCRPLGSPGMNKSSSLGDDAWCYTWRM